MEKFPFNRVYQVRPGNVIFEYGRNIRVGLPEWFEYGITFCVAGRELANC